MYMVPIERPIQLKVLLSKEEREQLEELAERQGLDVSNFLRQYIRREHASLEPVKATKKKR